MAYKRPTQKELGKPHGYTEVEDLQPGDKNVVSQADVKRTARASGKSTGKMIREKAPAGRSASFLASAQTMLSGESYSRVVNGGFSAGN